MGKRRLVTSVGAVMVMAGAGVVAAGCFDSSGDCSATATCARPGEGGGGGGVVVPAGCVPSEAGWAAHGCGVFVRASGDDGAAGTPAAPLKTLGAAIEKAATNGGRVYACAESFAEAIEVPGGVTVYGGLDCANRWAWVGETRKTEVVGPADVVAVWIGGGEGVARLEDVAVRAADAVTPGASSIAVLVDQVSAELVRCELRAGNGADGAPGAWGAEPDAMGVITAAAAGLPGNAGKDACTDVDGMGGPDPALLGGAPVLNECGGGLTSVGGGGGNGNTGNGSDGSAGQTGMLGAPGKGEPATESWSCSGSGAGQGGSDGMHGLAGAGATGVGTLTASGYVGVSGGAGMPGQPGQGGGGGGGAKGSSSSCAGNLGGAGASGGSGGAGGCGGQPGQGGGAGGASIALASVGASVTLKGCTLTAGNGGRGGAGGDSQAGGAGGAGGPGGQPAGNGGLKAACDGGKGGQGGNGGPGGGGLGGPSAAIAYVGAAVTNDDATTLLAGTAGAGGPGGNNNGAMNSGAEGAAAPELGSLLGVGTPVLDP